MIQPSATFQYERALAWFRRDLRDFDHAALYHALKSARQVFCVFIFDREILDRLEDRADRRVEFIWESVAELAAQIARRGGMLLVRHAHARVAIPALAVTLQVQAVYANHDYEPLAQQRDAFVADELDAHDIAFASSKDQVIFERDEIVAQSGSPFSVFTPYKNAWLRALTPFHLRAYPVDRYAANLARPPAAFVEPMPSLEEMGFCRTNLAALKLPTGMRGGASFFADFRTRIAAYKDARDFPAVKGPSYLSVHLRFGTVSIRELAAFAYAVAGEPDGAGAATWLSELIWRDFYAQILWHHPHVVSTAFRPQYANLPFPNDNAKFVAWCDGRTGYPVVDAAMRQLNRTGYMHNRLRMIVASFLVKDLLVDWRWGERYFAAKLIDFDLASNNGGWQWAASTGCDAQPYFRIFNPVTQSQRFDPAGTFIRRYVPELAALSGDAIHAPWQLTPALLAARGIVLGRDYPQPIVDHAVSRRMALALFKGARAGEGV